MAESGIGGRRRALVALVCLLAALYVSGCAASRGGEFTDGQAPVTGGVSVDTDPIWDAKGDLAVATGNNTAINLPVGANDQVLTASSTTATGLLWTAALSGLTINSSVVGGSTAAAGTFTTLTATTADSGTTTVTALALGTQAATSSAVMVAYGQYFANEYTATTTLSFANGNVQYIRLTSGAQTLTLQNPKAGGRYMLILQQPASGAAATISWPSTVSWSDGTAVTLSTDANDVDIIGCVYSGVTARFYCGFSTNY